ncbi:MAG: Choline-sulfatase [Candidatus Moanabacter tarae]|uniref:Choline-sulfatase n=1 Tax=Candidatus Moanibacter tarae TaxID=2200854 RepID=A0A2Z4AFT1_9BACT|nr:MAG: Choline-sulfatase [Candidatus Moanabacter tarae]
MNKELSFRPPRKPNVIWVFGDQHRAQALSHRGDPNVFTPNIDNLSRTGMNFECAVSGAPWCTPFRGALLTGKYPHQNGVIRTPSLLDPDIPTVAHSFNDAGYHTAYVGKWHLDGSNHREHYVPPHHRGSFKFWMGYENNNNQHETYVYGSKNETPQRLPKYETEGLTDILLGHLEKHVGQREDYDPFFAVLSVQPPHGPYVTPINSQQGKHHIHPSKIKLRNNVPEIPSMRFNASIDHAGYYAMIEDLDQNIGRICETLKDFSIDRETYIIFFSDHGNLLWSHGQTGKSSPWEESIRIPFIISKVGGPENMCCGRTDALLNHVDIAPTTLGLCGIPVPNEMAGYDYSRHCIPEYATEYRENPDRTDEPDSAYLQQIVRKMNPNTVNKAWRGVLMRDGWKYVCIPGSDWLLFDTKNDPYEQANHVHSTNFQMQKVHCYNRLSRWIKETGDDFELPNIRLP